MRTIGGLDIDLLEGVTCNAWLSTGSLSTQPRTPPAVPPMSDIGGSVLNPLEMDSAGTSSGEATIRWTAVSSFARRPESIPDLLGEDASGRVEDSDDFTHSLQSAAVLSSLCDAQRIPHIASCPDSFVPVGVTRPDKFIFFETQP